MTIAVAYWCVAIAALLPYVWVVIAKRGGAGSGRFDNRDPRGWIASQSEPRIRRANAAQLNAFEAFPAFAAGVILAQLAGVAHERIALLAVVFVIARVLHGIVYIANLAAVRSAVWAVGILSVFALLVQAALAVR